MARAPSQEMLAPLLLSHLPSLGSFISHTLKKRDTEWEQSSNNSPTVALYNISNNIIQPGNTEKGKGKGVINYGDSSSLHIGRS